MQNYEVISTKGEPLFTGTLDEIAEEFEIELNRIMGCETTLELTMQEGKVNITLKDNPHTPKSYTVKMLTMHTSETITDNLTKPILVVLGVGEIVAV